jgi:SnoaL-like domain
MTVEGARLAELVDRTEILDVYARYALGMDRGDGELFASAWTEDAVWICEALNLDLRGKEAIIAYFDRGPGAAPSTPKVGGNIRLAANHHIVIDGERAVGTAEMASFKYTGELVHPYSVGVYDDRFIRTSEGWRMSYRNMVVTPVIPPPAVGAVR